MNTNQVDATTCPHTGRPLHPTPHKDRDDAFQMANVIFLTAPVKKRAA